MEESVKCEICGSVLKNRMYYLRHKKQSRRCLSLTQSEPDFKYNCDVCGKGFMRKDTLKNHMNRKTKCVGVKKAENDPEKESSGPKEPTVINYYNCNINNDNSTTTNTDNSVKTDNSIDNSVDNSVNNILIKIDNIINNSVMLEKMACSKQEFLSYLENSEVKEVKDKNPNQFFPQL